MHVLAFNVLRSLDDREFRSGEVLARNLGVSRASIYNALADAERLGAHVQRVHGRGYRLAQALDWLDAERACAEAACAGWSVEIVDQCSSTNACLLARAEQGERGRIVLATELQSAGRGRLGRVWHSGLAGGLTFSVLWRFDRPVALLAGLSLAVGVATARALRRLGAGVGLKWPNDILFAGRKLGGILIEVRGDALGPCNAVIGVGLNVRLRADERVKIDQAVADLGEIEGFSGSRTRLLVDILIELERALDEFGAEGFAASRDEWGRYHCHQDQVVRLSLPGGAIVQGIARGVDESGRLLLETGTIVKSYLAGDVSLRSAHDSGD